MSFKCVSKGTPTLFPLVLNAPTNFAMGTPTSTTMPVTWTAPAQGTAIGYKVYEGTTLLATVSWPATGTTVTGLTNSKSYTFYVVTYEDRGESADSNTDTATTAAAPTEPVGTIFNETFESQDMASTNVDGFAWDTMNRTTISTSSPTCDGYTEGQCVVVFNSTGTVCNLNDCPLNGGDYYAYDGDYNLRFHYYAYDSGNPGAGSWTEQRYNFGVQHEGMWMSYWLRVPSNWDRDGGTQTGGGTNNKFGVHGWGDTKANNYDTQYPISSGWGLESYKSAATPASGKWNGNNATPSSITLIRVNDLDDAGSNKGSSLAAITLGIPIGFTQDNDATKSIRFTIDSIADNTDHIVFGVTYESTGVGGVPDVGADTTLLTWPDNEFSIELKDWPDTLTAENIEFEITLRGMSDSTHQLSYVSFDGGSYHDFITPSDQGRWMHLVFDLTASTDIDTANGHVRIYRMWEGDSAYTTVGVAEGIVMAAGGRGGTGFGYGYFMGYANVEYAAYTEWFIDNVRFSTTDLRIT